MNEKGGAGVKIPRFMLAAPNSGSGKTLITCGLLQALKNRGLQPASFKCGPDYIDPLFHTKVLGVPSRNLDTYFTGRDLTCALFGTHAQNADLAVMEGVMGFYDGVAGVTCVASSWELADVTDTPVILVINMRGMSLSVAALIRGFQQMKPESHIRGVILNQTSEFMCRQLRPVIEDLCQIPVLGYVPKVTDCVIESRHLGLVTPDELTDLQERIEKLAEILVKKQKEYQTEIYLISDEPYRELAYDGVEVPYLTKYYANTIVGYSYSKSLSLPGERIGYLVIPDEVKDSETLISAANVANRILGFVNAPTLQQKVVEKCIGEKTDISFYDRNRETLYNGLRELGYECIKPQGAFYLFVKSPVANEKEFVAKAKEYHILIVPGSSFACPGYVRLAYCTSYETIVNSLPKFAEMAKEYGL